MSSKPKIFAFCDAGCKWETVHKSEIEEIMARYSITHVATGSYKGTETYGAANPCIIPCDFTPKLVILIGYHGNTAQLTDYYQGINKIVSFEELTDEFRKYRGFSTDLTDCYGRKNGNALEWYDVVSAEQQYNRANYTYEYAILG